jgi:hypothetical protein
MTVTPVLASLYTGTIHTIAANVTTIMLLTNVQLAQGKVSGSLSLGEGLHGSGPFHGTFNAAKHVQFTVTDVTAHTTLSFEGTLQSDGNLAGSYCQIDSSGHCSGDYGVWSVTPAALS